MQWQILFHDEFDAEFDKLPVTLQNELLAHLQILQQYGPALGRPLVDTVNGSSFHNMKEMRFSFQKQPYRYFFAFDFRRQAVVLTGGSKANDKKFYHKMIAIADRRFKNYLDTQRED